MSALNRRKKRLAGKKALFCLAETKRWLSKAEGQAYEESFYQEVSSRKFSITTSCHIGFFMLRFLKIPVCR